IGASRDSGSVGYGILRNLIHGCVFSSEYCRGFKGRVFAVNPNAEEILGIRCYSNIKVIKEKIDLAIVAVPAKFVLSVIRDCVKKKVKGIILISAGFAEFGKKGRKMQEDIVGILKKARIPLIGPNCLGIIRPCADLNASFAPSMPPKGKIAFVSQSGAIADSIIDWAITERYGFSALISYGNKAMLDCYDFLEWLGNDKETKAIALYIEGLNDGRKFMEIAKKVSRKKPIVVLKAGRTDAGKKAIASHTGSLAGSYRIYESAFKQSGLVIADTIEGLFDIAKGLANQPNCKKNAVAIVTNGGGCGVLCADFCEKLGVNVVELKKSTVEKLDKSGKMHPA
ncbi:MAG: CoA-binding protein, partial [Candidatus Aenigmarchaeota archaeon]|nr:CoA-binding protein [Candidatus Aenigmarchaeota archaeon]